MLISVAVQSVVLLQTPPSARLPGSGAEEPVWEQLLEGYMRVHIPASTGPSSCRSLGDTHTAPIHSES